MSLVKEKNNRTSNSVRDVNMNKIREFKNNINIDSNTFVVIINGEKAPDNNSFIAEAYDKLFFPNPQYANWDAYNDWMRDLSWIDEKHIVIIVSSWNKFLKNGGKEEFICDLDEDILPYWEEELSLYGYDTLSKKLEVYYSYISEKDLYELNNDRENKFIISRARKYIKDNYQMDIIGCIETDDFWMFTVGDKNRKMYGNPRIIMEKGSYALRDASISMTEVLKIAREGKRLI